MPKAPRQLYNIDQVSEITGLSVQTIYRRTRLKTFPEPEETKGKKHWAKTKINKWAKQNAKSKETPVARDRIRTIEEPKVDPFVEAVERSVQGQLVAETESQKRKRMVIGAILIAILIVAVVIAI